MTTCLPSALSVIIAVAVVASEARAADPSLDVVGAWGGPVNAVHVEDGVAYLGSGRRLVVLDVSDINNFIELGSVALGSTVQDLAVRDGMAFVLTQAQPNIFNVIDVSTPVAPKVLWSSGAAPAWSLNSNARNLAIHGDYAYILEFHGNIRIVDIANPLNPVGPGVAVAAVAPGSLELIRFNDFAIADDRLYAATGYYEQAAKSVEVPSLRLYDLAANPVNPPLLSSIEIDLPDHSGELLFVTVVGNYAYALARHKLLEAAGGGEAFFNLAVIDVSSPRAPKLVTPAAASFAIRKHGIAAANGRLFIAAGADPSQPVPTGPAGWSAAEGLIIYDIAEPGGDPAAPAFVKSYKTHGSIFGVHPVGNTAWLSDTGEGLIALDVTNPLNPVRKDNFHSPAFLTGLDKRDALLFVSDLWNGFTILDVADAAAPQVVGVYQTPMTPPPFGKGEPTNNGIFNADIAVRDNRAYLAAGYGGIHVVDVANPATPVKIGGSTPVFTDLARATAIELDGDFAHLGVRMLIGGTGLYSNYNITDTVGQIVLPLVGSVELGKGPDTIATRQGYSYLAMGGYLTVINSTVPAAPMVVSESGTPSAYDLAIADDLLYVADGHSGGTGGLKIYSLAQRDAPAAIDGGFYPGSHTSAVALQNQRAYAVISGGGSPGYIALDVADPAQPQPIAFQPDLSTSVGENVLLADEPHIFTATGDGDTFRDVGLSVLKINGCLDSAGDADFNCDGVVNGFDLALLLSQWTGASFYSPCPPNIPADLSHDCRVNGGDLAILLGDWG